jgi:hypothetical protein
MSGFLEKRALIRPSWEETSDETDVDLRPRARRISGGTTHHLLCDAQYLLSRLDALVGTAPEAIRDGITARMAYSEASGWLAFVHAWVDPLDLALRDLNLTGSYTIATRAGRPALALPNTASRQAHQAVAGALDVVRSHRRNDVTVAAPIDPPDGLVLPKAVFPPFWAAYPTLGHGPVNGLPMLCGDVRVRVGAEGPDDRDRSEG